MEKSLIFLKSINLDGVNIIMKVSYYYLLLFFSMPGLAEITPAITLPDRSKHHPVTTHELSENTLGVQLSSISSGRCHIKFQDFFMVQAVMKFILKNNHQ
ncbi:hypothetical protein C5469_22770 [Photorhabdus cinerea]|uniref:Uncharacterized protein n=1 Tax=Photorhabdus cinerea TaxID=471575 RepID=A0A7X5QI36_9GAMM|nr:hypothetical protein [Photorhabdus cinerea]